MARESQVQTQPSPAARTHELAQRCAVVPSLCQHKVGDAAHQRSSSIAYACISAEQDQRAHLRAAGLDASCQCADWASAHRAAKEHDALRGHVQQRREVRVGGPEVRVDALSGSSSRADAVALRPR